MEHTIEKRTLRWTLTGTLLLMIWSIGFSLFTDSNIIELDAASYAISGIIGIVTLYVSAITQREANEKYPLGFYGFVPILILLRSLMIILICLDSIVESIEAIIHEPEAENSWLLIYYSIGAFIINACIYFIVKQNQKKAASELLKAEETEWRIDLLFTVSIFISFVGIAVLHQYGFTKLAAYIDPSICLLLSIYMCKEPILLFKENMDTLSVTSVEKELQDKIIERIERDIPRLKEIPCTYRLVRVAGVLWLDLEMTLGPIEVIQGKNLVAGTRLVEQIMREYHPKAKVTYVIV